MKITVLGCGSSGGVPLITGEWGHCDPTHPKNRRLRSSLLIEIDGFNLLIDSSTDLRQQLLACGINRIDAVLYTHAHADHILGIDELRQIYLKHRSQIPIFADPETLAALTRTFPYIFSQTDPLYPNFLKAMTFERDKPFSVGPLTVIPFYQTHGKTHSYGFRLGKLAYSTDFKDIPDSSLALLTGLGVWIVDCLRDEEHPTHSHTALTFEMIARVNPARAILTHMNERLDYEDLCKRCPPGITPAYDGLVVEL